MPVHDDKGQTPVYYIKLGDEQRNPKYLYNALGIYKSINELALRQSLIDVIYILSRDIGGHDADDIAIYSSYINTANMPYYMSISPTPTLGTVDNNLLSGVVDTARLAITKLDAHESLVGMTVYVTDPKYVTDPNLPCHITISGIKIVECFSCKYCDKVVAVEHKDLHALHPGCQLAAEKAKVIASGFDALSNINEIIVVRSLGVEYKMVPQYMDFYVPAWVRQAIDMFNSQQEGGSYAGMQLTEFLLSMRPTSGESK